LPTEFEWEYAAHGTDGRVYPYGDTFDARKCSGGATGIGQTSAAGIFPDGESPFGLLDTSGNVWEWCLNKYDDLGYINIDVIGARRALRGGSFGNYDSSLRAANRSSFGPDFNNFNIGFRCALFSP
jgi:formylglycine-generating enzyme required for sulfatase activity